MKTRVLSSWCIANSVRLADLAEYIGCSYAILVRVDNGHEPKINIAIKLYWAMGREVPLEDLCPTLFTEPLAPILSKQ